MAVPAVAFIYAAFETFKKIGEVVTNDPTQSVSVTRLGNFISDQGLVAVEVGKKGLASMDVSKAKRQSGYMRKSDLDTALNLSTVEIPANFAGLEAIDIPTRLADQYFEIIDVDEEENEVTITARHIWYSNIQNNTLWKPTADANYTAAAVCKNVLNNAMFPVEFEVESDCTDTLPAKELDFERKNLVEAFLDPEKGICKKFGLSLIRDNWRFYCLKNVGYDRGFIVERGKNMLGVERTESIENLVTRVAPIAKDSKGGIIWLDNNGLKYIDSQYIDDYSSPRLEIFDTGLQIGKDGVTSQNVQEKLLEAAQKRFSEDKVDLPEVTMRIEFISLGDTEEYKQYRDLDKVYLYDILTVKDPEKGYNYSAQVIGVEHDILTGRLNSVTIGMLRQADASRKIAVWQVPEVDGANIRLLSIQAGSFEPGAIQHDDIAPRIITADLIKSGEIQTEHLQAGSVTTEKLEAEAVTAGKIGAGAITTEKLDAFAVTSSKIAAGAVTADKIDANAITADKISTTDLDAINAKLGTAQIANAQIATADINFAHIKDLNAQSAYFGQTIFDEGVGGKLYVPRLNVGYAQMLGATIGDLVIQASNGNFYGIDVAADGSVTATQRTVSAGEIAAGHTSDGRTLVLGTDILATDLSTENIYASHALMNEITAAVINVDELWARQAFIGKLMTTDITSNTYIRSQVVDKIGNWTSSSTITQSINSLNSRISEMGYGTVYFQPNEPSHENLTEGDIWVKSSNVADWNDLYSRQEEGQYVFADWQAVYNAFDDWQTLCAVDRMFVWTGVNWKEMYDAKLPDTLETEINQLASEITLKASRTEVDLLADEVTEFSAQLTIQAEEIQSAVSAVNLKAASYVMQADPRTAYTVSVGDIWVKWDGVVDWTDIYNRHDDWQAVYNKFGDWSELIGSKSYVWNGFEWVETSDRASEIEQRTLISQTRDQVTILAEASATLNDELYRTKAELQVTNSAIIAEVERATTAEGGKLDKTQQYQTADSIVTAARNYVNGILQSESEIRQTATGITAYVQDYAYQKRSYIDITANGIEISGSKYIKIKSGGSFTVEGGNFNITTGGDVSMTGSITATSITANQGGTIAGWSIAANKLSSGTGESYVCLASSGTYAIYAGNSNAGSAPFRVTPGGEVTLTKLKYLNANGTETVFNPRTGLWKLDYHTVKAYSTDSITLSNGAVINFIKASSLSVGGGAGKVSVLNAGSEVSGTSRAVVVGIDTDVEKTYSGGYINFNAKAFFSAVGGATIVSSPCVIEDKDGSGLAYDAGKNSVTVTSVTLGSWVSGNQYNCTVALSSGNKASTINCASAINRGWDNAYANVRMPGAGTSASFTVRTPNEARTGADTHTFTITKGTPSASGGYAAVSYNNTVVGRISLLDWWQGGYDTARGYVTMPSAGTGTSFTVKVPNAARTGADTHTFTVTKGTPSADGGYAAVRYNNSTVARISLDDWWEGGYEAGLAEGGYNDGWDDARSNVSMPSAGTGTSFTVRVPNAARTGSESRNFTITKGTPSESGGYAAVRYNNTQVARISLDDWWDAGYEAGLEAGGYAEGYSAGLSDYYSSQYWAKATAQNNWIPQIPNETNTGSEGWVNSGASDAYTAGESGVTVTRVTLGSLITGTQYNCSVLLSSGLTRAGTINCATAYSDARSGYTPGIFTQYSGAQLYTMGQSGPERYTGTLYTKA